MQLWTFNKITQLTSDFFTSIFHINFLITDNIYELCVCVFIYLYIKHIWNALSIISCGHIVVVFIQKYEEEYQRFGPTYITQRV